MQSKKKALILSGAVMALVTSSIISTAIVSLNVYFLCSVQHSGGVECFKTSFLNIWPRSFAVTFLLAFLIILFVAPYIMRITNK